MPVCTSGLTLLIATAALCSTPMMGSAKNFLEAVPLGADVVEESLLTELTANVSSERLGRLKAALDPTYKAVPKNHFGLLTHEAVRYVLHRFFIAQHGWYIKGLEPTGDTWHTLPEAASKDWIPSYLQGRIENLLHHGTDLHSLAVLAAALEDIVHKEAGLRLDEIYQVLKLPTSGDISRQEAQEAIDTYMVVYLVSRKVNISTPEQAELKRKRFKDWYRGYSEMHAWLTKVEEHHESLQGNKGIDFPTVRRIVEDVGQRYAEFNERECGDLRSTLLEMESKSLKAGRVRLVDFYNRTLYTHWNFNEKIDYLRELGALDETSPSQPLVIVPNYVTARNNCLKPTTLYSVCCRDVCEDLLGHLEREIGAPRASPEQIAKLVAALPSATVAAPRALPQRLSHRLEELGAANGGEVNLHGRLFAQWMHHAFPRECPFPHEAGTTSPQTADEWMARTGTSASASEEEMQKIVQDACSADGSTRERSSAEGGDEASDLPWTNAEELLVIAHPQLRASRRHTFSALALLAAMAAGLLAEKKLKGRRELEQCRLVLVLCLFILALYAGDMLDSFALLLPMAAGLVFSSLRWSRAQCAEKPDRCLA